MKQKFYTIRIALIVFCAMPATPMVAQVSGTVFRDMNANGVWDLSNPTEPGEYGVTVKAYNAANTLVATVTTNASGYYSFTTAQTQPTKPYRLEFSATPGDFPSKRIAADRSNIQFVVAGSSAVNINYAIATQKLTATTSNPYVATTAATNGNALATGTGNAGDNNSLYVFPYDLSNDGTTTRRTKNQYTGSVFGLAWQRESRILLMSAYLKRHAGFGSGGIGAIYKSQISVAGVPANPSLLLNVSTLGINVGTDPRVTTLPSASTTANTDAGVFSQIGKRGIGGMELADNGRDLYIVNMYQQKLHRINIGNPLKSSFTSADVTGSWTIPAPAIAGTIWHPMALKSHNGKMYVGGICSKETTAKPVASDTVNLSAVVYEVDITLATPTFTEVFRTPLTHRRGFTNADYRYATRNNYWSAWQNNGDISINGPLRGDLLGDLTLSGNNATGIYYAQPLFSTMEFDVDGSMIIALRDRFGDQGGYSNLFETGNGTEEYRTLASGEVLRAGKTGSTWKLENGASVLNNGVTTATTGVADNNPLLSGVFALLTGAPWGGSYGPGGKYFYYNQNFTNTGVPAAFAGTGTVTSHYLKSNGGLALLPGYNEVMTTAIDPMSTSYTNGVIKNYNLGSNAGNMSGRMELMQSASGDPTNMGKAAALGDLELLLDAQAVEIGNRVWNDVNANGRQDAGEAGISGVKVYLRSPGADGIYNNGDDQTWNVTTDANGNYYFDKTIVNDTRRPASWIGVSSTSSGILPGFEYKVQISPAQSALTGMLLTFTNTVADEIDSDGSYNSTSAEYIINPGGSTAANSSFENNYNVDFGFSNNALLVIARLDLSAKLINTQVQIQWNTTGEQDISKYTVERSTDAKQFNATSTVSSKGNGNFSYQSADNIDGITATVLYYRIKILDLNGSSHYSATVLVSNKTITQRVVTPNPFVSFVQVQASADKSQAAQVRLLNAGGQLVTSKNLQMVKGLNTFTLDGLAGTSKGMYFLELQSGAIVIREKIMKQ